MELVEEKGFAAVLFIVLVVAISGLIVGGAFYAKKNLTPKLSSSPSQGSSETPALSSLPPVSPNSGLNASPILTPASGLPIPSASANITTDYGLLIGFDSLKNLKSMSSNPNLYRNLPVLKTVDNDGLISPDQTKVLLANTVYTFATDSDVALDTDKIGKDVFPSETQPAKITFTGWSTDSNVLVGLAESFDSNGKTIDNVFSYDIPTGQTIIVDSNVSDEIPIFYDPQKKVLGFISFEGHQSSSQYNPNQSLESQLIPITQTFEDFNVKNLATGQSQNLQRDNLDNNFQYAANTQVTYPIPYFVNSDQSPSFQAINTYQGKIIYQNRRQLNIYSYYSPSQPVATINLDLSSDYTFGGEMLWSPDGKYFAVETYKNDFDSSATKADYSNGNYMIEIYNVQGKLISKVTSPNTTLSLWCTFSTDDNYLLLYSFSSTAAGTGYIFDVKSGQSDGTIVTPQVIYLWKR